MNIEPREFPPYVVTHDGASKLVVPFIVNGEKYEFDFDLKKPTAHRLVTELLKYLDPTP